MCCGSFRATSKATNDNLMKTINNFQNRKSHSNSKWICREKIESKMKSQGIEWKVKLRHISNESIFECAKHLRKAERLLEISSFFFVENLWKSNGNKLINYLEMFGRRAEEREKRKWDPLGSKKISGMIWMLFCWFFMTSSPSHARR